MNVLVVSHGHPTFSAGGAERAAYSLFRHLKNSDSVDRVTFAARVPESMIGHDANFGLFRGREDELLIATPPVDHFTYQSEHYDVLRKRVIDLLNYSRPDIVHLHHFVYFGLEIIDIIREAGARIVFTVHEYLAICNHFGQMVKTDGRLCQTSSPLECSRCFPESTPGKFFLREQIIKGMMGGCDFLISPSKFLSDRFTSWGVSPEAICVLENLLDPSTLEKCVEELGVSPGPIDARGDASLRIGYFGQLNPFKGIRTLLDAVQLIPHEERRRLHIGIHGANLDIQKEEFQDYIRGALDRTSDCVFSYGPYDNEVVVALMSNYDRVVVPSVWWENSPVVIQEARLAGTPLLMSRLGGMAEKAQHSVDVLFQGGSPISLAGEIVKLLKNGSRIRTDVRSLAGEQADLLRRHLGIYKSLMS